jgi:hypothetical protein
MSSSSAQVAQTIWPRNQAGAVQDVQGREGDIMARTANKSIRACSNACLENEAVTALLILVTGS